MNQLLSLNILIILVYITMVISVGLYAARTSSDGSKKYFFADYNLSWSVIALSLFATGFTSYQMLGFIGMSSITNMIPGQFGAIAALSILILGWIFAPHFIKEKIQTVPEYFEKKYNKSSRILFALFSILFYFFIRLSITLLVADFILNRILNMDAFTISQVIVIITGIYVIIGGLPSVVYTQVVQSFFILLTLIIIVMLSIYNLGDLGLLWNKLTTASNVILQPLLYTNTMKVMSFLGGLIIGIWFWCTDQFIIQRIISAKNKSHAQQAAVGYGFLYILLMILVLVIIIIADIFYSDKNLYIMFSKIVLGIMNNSGLQGIILTGTLAVLMASLASIFNSMATVITYDFIIIKNQIASERKFVLTGRLISLAAVIFTILYIPIIRIVPVELLSFLILFPIFCAPTFAALILFARLHNNNSRGAISVILLGMVLGTVYSFIVSFNHTLLYKFKFINSIIDLPYVYFTIIVFMGSYLILFIINAKQNQHNYSKQKIRTNFDRLKRYFFSGQLHNSEITVNMTISVILALIVISMWWVFKI